jgi:hypothetical protein
MIKNNKSITWIVNNEQDLLKGYKEEEKRKKAILLLKLFIELKIIMNVKDEYLLLKDDDSYFRFSKSRYFYLSFIYKVFLFY